MLILTSLLLFAGAEQAPPATTVPLFSGKDYPRAALRAGHEGTVITRLVVSKRGRVRKCIILSSSGHEELDRATCRVLEKRARFTPARDEQGRAVEDTVDAPPIVWLLPEGSGTPEQQPALMAEPLDPGLCEELKQDAARISLERTTERPTVDCEQRVIALHLSVPEPREVAVRKVMPMLGPDISGLCGLSADLRRRAPTTSGWRLHVIVVFTAGAPLVVQPPCG